MCRLLTRYLYVSFIKSLITRTLLWYVFLVVFEYQRTPPQPNGGDDDDGPECFGEHLRGNFDKNEGRDFSADIHGHIQLNSSKVSNHFFDPEKRGGGPVGRLERNTTESEKEQHDIVSRLGLSDAAGDDVLNFVKYHLRSFAAGGGGNEPEDYVRNNLHNTKGLRQKLKGLVNRKQDGDVEKATFLVKPEYRQLLAKAARTKIRFKFINVVAAAIELLTDPNHASDDNYLLRAERWDGNYGEFNTGQWFRDAERRSGVRDMDGDVYIMPLALYTDGSSVDFRRSLSFKPINVACLNLVGRLVRSKHGKMNVGFFPSLGLDSSKSTRVAAQHLSRKFYHWVVKKLVASIEKYRHGVRIKLNGREVTMVPVVAFVATDWPEGQKMAQIYGSATGSARNCRVCMRPTEHFGWSTTTREDKRRTQRKTKKKVRELKRLAKTPGKKTEALERAKQLSLHLESNGWWKAELFANKYGVHALLPMDTLHTVPYGVIHSLRALLLALCPPGDRRDEMNRRFMSMPRSADQVTRGLYYRIFSDGLSKLGSWTGDDYISLLQALPFVVGTTGAVIEDDRAREAFQLACRCTRLILLVLKMRVVNENALARMHCAAKRIAQALQVCTASVPVSRRSELMGVNRPKIHALVHFRYFIRRFGAACNFDTGTWETAHKWFCHETFKRDCNREANRETRLMEACNLNWCFQSMMDRKVGDPPIKQPTSSLSLPVRDLERRGQRTRRNIGVAAALEELGRTRGQHVGVGRLTSRLWAGLHDMGVMDEVVEKMGWYKQLKVDHGEEATIYIAASDYQRSKSFVGGSSTTTSRFDFVDVLWDVGDHVVVVLPAQVLFFFGCDEQMPRGSKDGHMYAFVHGMEAADSTAEATDMGFDRFKFEDPKKDTSYHVIHLSAISGRAQIIRDFDADTDGLTLFWKDDVLPDLLLKPLEEGEPFAPRRATRRGGGGVVPVVAVAAAAGAGAAAVVEEAAVAAASAQLAAVRGAGKGAGSSVVVRQGGWVLFAVHPARGGDQEGGDGGIVVLFLLLVVLVVTQRRGEAGAGGVGTICSPPSSWRGATEEGSWCSCFLLFLLLWGTGV